ncbi:MAG: type II toxin-antitoxin system HicA family toxin [archaeon]
MVKLPVISSKDLCKVLCLIDYKIDHQKGSHLILIKEGICRLVVPVRKNIAKGTLKAILRQANLKSEDLLKLLEKI